MGLVLLAICIAGFIIWRQKTYGDVRAPVSMWTSCYRLKGLSSQSRERLLPVQRKCINEGSVRVKVHICLMVKVRVCDPADVFLFKHAHSSLWFLFSAKITSRKKLSFWHNRVSFYPKNTFLLIKIFSFLSHQSFPCPHRFPEEVSKDIDFKWNWNKNLVSFLKSPDSDVIRYKDSSLNLSVGVKVSQRLHHRAVCT